RRSRERMKVLFLSPFFPYPFSGAGTHLRNYYSLRHLSRRGHEVDLLSFRSNATTEEDVEQVRPFCRSLTLIGEETARVNEARGRLFRGGFDPPGLPYHFLGKGYSPEMQEAVDAALSSEYYDAVHVSEVRMAPYVHRWFAQPVVLDYEHSVALYHRRVTMGERLAARDLYWLH